MLRGLTLTALLAASPATVTGQDVSVRAYLSPGATVGVGRQFVLNVEITGTQALTEQPTVPDLDGFSQFLGSSQQSSIRMVNGRTSVTLTIQYRFQAIREGTFDIPPFDVEAGGQLRRTERLQITVAPTAPTGGESTREGEVAGEDLFVTAEATKTRVLDGEPLVVEYRIWTRVDVSSFTLTRVPEPQGFWVEDVTPSGQPQVEQLSRNGQAYTTAIVRRVVLVPTGAGERTLGPVGLEAQVRVRSRDPFDDFFGRSSLFGTSFASTAVLSNPLTISVQPLPGGRPQPFSGVVGTLRLTAELDRDAVDANDAVTLTIRATGEGNIRAVPPPELNLPPDFEVFPPEVSESVRPFGPGLSGEKSFEYVLIPRAPGRRELGPFTMSYFDLGSGAYRMAATAGLTLTVTGIEAGGPVQLSRGGVAQLREDIRFIHLGGTLRRAERMLFTGVGFWMFALLPLVAVAGTVGLRRHRDLLEGDVAYARGRRASRVAKKRLSQARGLARGAADSRAFYAEVARALRGLVADRLNLAEAGLQAGELEAHLKRHGVGEDTVQELMACLDHCDRRRFAPSHGDPAETTRFLDRVSALMTTVDRAVR